jgi:hypothetical protein
MSEHDPTTEELRVRQMQREEESRIESDRAPEDEDTSQFDRRADKAAYLKRKLEERDRAEREASERDRRESE